MTTLGLIIGDRNDKLLQDFRNGTGDTKRDYTDEKGIAPELQDMINSPGATAMRQAFARGDVRYANDTTRSGETTFYYGTGTAFVETILDPRESLKSTAMQVGGFKATAVKVLNNDGSLKLEDGKELVTYTITNAAGRDSYYYHLRPDKIESTGPERNIYQTFTWTEKAPVLSQNLKAELTPLEDKGQLVQADTPHEFQSALELMQASTRNTNEVIAAREQQNTQTIGKGQGGYSGGISRC